VVPPRDLQSWQQLPVSAIATLKPVAANDLSATALQKLLRKHPYQRFPAIADGMPQGILTRKEAEAAIAEQRTPKLDPLVTCLPDQTIRELQSKLIESTSLMVIILEHPRGRILGLVTLHDLLRAEVALANQGST
jgi:CIC family chloride channel protein